jgi:four helix bundle protein
MRLVPVGFCYRLSKASIEDLPSETSWHVAETGMIEVGVLAFCRFYGRSAVGAFRARAIHMAPTARNIGELIAWQLANEHADLIFDLIQNGPCVRDATFCEQIRDSSGAIAPLIAEGFARFTPPEFAKYLRWAKAEITETQSHLRKAQGRRYFTEDQLTPVWRISKRLMKATTRLLEAKLAQIEEEHRSKRSRRADRHP